jgi:hypothetical protein
MGPGVNGISDEVEPTTPPSWPFPGAHRTPLASMRGISFASDHCIYMTSTVILYFH